MNAAEAPFPTAWWGIGLENVSLGGARPDVGTYGCYGFNALPPAPLELNGDFAWLAAAQRHRQNIGREKRKENAAAIKGLRASTDRLGLRLPESFVRFFETPSLQERVRSNTDCFLDLCPEPVASPVPGDFVIRFLADSQGCVFWYLYLPADKLDHAVVASTKFYGTAAEQWDQDDDSDDIVFCAESFEIFMWRFWIENEIWFADHEKKPLPQIGIEYIASYRRQQDAS